MNEGEKESWESYWRNQAIKKKEKKKQVFLKKLPSYNFFKLNQFKPKDFFLKYNNENFT